MRLSSVFAILIGVLKFAFAAPVTELPNGLPNPTQEQLRIIQQRAHGIFPNRTGPSNISQNGILTLKAIAFNELAEVALFSQLLSNVTNNVTGFHVPIWKRDYVSESLTTIVGQEEMHAISANKALQAAGVGRVLPCDYRFPVNNLDEGITLAYKYTDLVLGVLQAAERLFSLGRDTGLVRLFASIIGQEGEQAGWYRALQHKVPSELPFLTSAEPSFAASVIVNEFAVPGSCPNASDIPLPIFRPMKVLTQSSPSTQPVKFALETKNQTVPNPIWVTYINQQNLPIVQPLEVLSHGNGTVIVQATFPYEAHMMNGLTVALVTNSGGPFSSANAVVDATEFGPGLIVVK